MGSTRIPRESRRIDLRKQRRSVAMALQALATAVRATTVAKNCIVRIPGTG